MNTTELLALAAAIVPERDALIFEGRRFSFAQLQERVNRLANAMADLGSGPATGWRRCRSTAMRALNFTSPPPCSMPSMSPEFPGQGRGTGADVSHRPTQAAGSGRAVSAATGRGRAAGGYGNSYPGRPGRGRELSYDALLEYPPEELHFPQGEGADTTVIMFTSGTTDLPKGVQLSHDSFTSYLLSNVTPGGSGLGGNHLLTAPLYHIAGLQAALAAIYGGRTLAIMRQFDPREWLTLAQEWRVNRAMLVPTMLKQLLDYPDFDRFDLSALEVITYGAAPMPLPVIRQAIARLSGCALSTLSGKRKRRPPSRCCRRRDHILEGRPEEVEVKLRRLSSIGKPLEDVEVLIVDEQGKPVAVGETGEIVARGARMMQGYWQQAAATGETLRGGWVYTGDLAYQDGDGYIYLAGRPRISSSGGER